MGERVRSVKLLGLLLVLGATVAVWTCSVGSRDRGLEAASAAPPGEAAMSTSPARRSPEKLKLRVLRELPHDPSAFTQGLLLHQGQLYESTGQYGQSSLRRWSQATGEVQQRVKLGPGLFGEGLALVEDRLIQLTWRRGRALVYDLASLRKLSSFEYAGEGWGLTFDGAALVMSDGSDTLTFRDPASFRPLRHMRVRLRGRPLRNLNELEWATGSIYANVWMQDWIARIDPATGEVTGVIDASGLLTASERARADVLNGIAYDQESGRFVITGKLWPKAFEVELVPATER